MGEFGGDIEIDESSRTLIVDNKEYTWRESEDEAEEEARNSLIEEDYFWKQAVQSGHTTDSLEGWVDTVVNIDGWQHIICNYDGTNGYIDIPGQKEQGVYWRTN
jgi:hypothetical protein